MKTLLFATMAVLVAFAVSGRGQQPKQPAEEKPYQLEQLQGKFVGIKATNKRHQSYIFEFLASNQLHGPGQAPDRQEGAGAVRAL